MFVKAWLLSLLMLPITAHTAAVKLRVFCWEGYAEPLSESFKKHVKQKMNIDVEVEIKHVSNANEFFNVLRSNTADVISPAHNVSKSEKFDFIGKKLLMPLDLSLIPNYEKLNKFFYKADYAVVDGKVYNSPLIAGPYAFMYDKGSFSKAPDSWTLFWDPKYAGKYSISKDYYEANVYTAALSLGLKAADLGNFEKLKATKELQEKVNLLAKGAKVMWEGVDKAQELADLPFATGWGFALADLNKMGKKWEFTWPKEGTTAWVDNWAVNIAVAKDPVKTKVVHEWINYSLEEDHQLGYMRNLSAFPTIKGLDKKANAEEKRQFHLDDPNYVQNNFVLWPILNVRLQNLLDNIWNAALKKAGK